MATLRIEEGATDLTAVFVRIDTLMEDLFTEHGRMSRLQRLAHEAAPGQETWDEVSKGMMESLGYERMGGGVTATRENDLDGDFTWHVWAAPGWEGLDWSCRSELNDSGYVPDDDHSPLSWASPVLGELDEEEHETLPLVVVVVLPYQGYGCRSEDRSPVVGYFEGDATVPGCLSVQWSLEPCDEDDDEASDLAEDANNDWKLSSAEATCYLETDYAMEIVKEDGDLVPFNKEKNAFKVQNKEGQQFWASPSRHYFGQ